MDEYLVGVVKQLVGDKIIFECNNRGYLLAGVKLNSLPINENLKLYIYFFNKPKSEEYFAFLNYETKKYFLELVKINSIGPKTALKILNNFSLMEFKTILLNKNYFLIKKCKGVSKKSAQLIISHFANQDKVTNTLINQEKQELIFNSLMQLGFNQEVINNYF